MSSQFYTSIAPYYQHIFPFNPTQIEFLKYILPYNGARVLDVGCATGDLAFALTHFGFPTWAIDFDERMIDTAQNAKPEDTMFPVFEHLDMGMIDQHYPESCFDTVICFGNTLVHLLSDLDILQFFKGAWKVLSAEGKLTFQILNYDYILENQVKNLPIIENEHIRFEREYHFQEESESINFQTRLFVKETKEEISNTVKLYPIRQERLKALLMKAGFGEIKMFGSFKRDELSSKSLLLVVSCEKQDW